VGRIEMSRLIRDWIVLLLASTFPLDAAVLGTRATTQISALPMPAQSSISAALGRDLISYWISAGPAGLLASNARQSLAMDFNTRGVYVRAGNMGWGLNLHAYGYGTRLCKFEEVVPQANLNSVEYTYGALTEWYVNGPLGLEQGITIYAPPGKSQRTALTFEFFLSGDFKATVGSDRRSLMLRNGSVRLRYAGLSAHDAAGKVLQSWLRLSGKHLLLRVRDAKALYPIVIDPWIQLAQLTASGGSANNAFGYSVAINSDTVVVGAVGANSYQGVAYVFTKSANGWSNMTETAQLTAVDGAAYDYFGESVAVSDDTVVVGAPHHVVGSNQNQGAAYIFVKPLSGWNNMTQTAELTSSDGAQGDAFGCAVAVSANTVVVGAAYANIDSNPNQGAAYVFVRPATGWADMTQTAKLTSSSGAAYDYFGQAVSVAGNTIVASAPAVTVGDNPYQGVAYVFVEPVNGWTSMTQLAELTASDGAAYDYFGESVSVSGDTMAVGAPGKTVGGNRNQGAAYIFVQPQNGWVNMTQTAELTASDGGVFDEFASAIAVNGDLIVIGSPHDTVNGNSAQGAAYLFVKPSAGWTTTSDFTNKFTLNGGSPYEFFGSAVSLTGNAAVVGDYYYSDDQGAAFVFGP